MSAKNKKLNVMSLFDGISCGRLACVRAGLEVENYYSSEVDKYAIQITQKNYPDTIQLGDVRNIDFTRYTGTIDLLIGGSPCQGFSFAGKQLNFDDPRSKLFFEFVRALKEIKPKYFLLENVKMKKEYEDIISVSLEVKPLEINSNLVSAQNRKRLYWTNIPNIEQPKNKKIHWCDIQENNVADNFYYSAKGLDWLSRHSKKTGKILKIYNNFDKVKMQMIEASHFKNYSSQRFFAIKDVKGLRYITPVECERCQTLPDNYTAGISNTQRYKCIGNGWTVDVIAYILSFIKEK